MSAVVVVLSVVAVLAALANWEAHRAANVRLNWWTKPVVSGALLTIALVGHEAHAGARVWWVAALVGCLAGDVLLMLPSDQFVAGLAAFLVGHVAFIIGLTQVRSTPGHAATGVRVALGVAAVGAGWGFVAPGVLAAVRRTHRRLLVPVVAYIVTISAMVLVAASWGGWWGLGGALLFFVSDSMLAWNRFVRASRLLAVAVIVAYHGALVGLLVALLR